MRTVAHAATFGSGNSPKSRSASLGRRLAQTCGFLSSANQSVWRCRFWWLSLTAVHPGQLFNCDRHVVTALFIADFDQDWSRIADRQASRHFEDDFIHSHKGRREA